MEDELVKERLIAYQPPLKDEVKKKEIFQKFIEYSSLPDYEKAQLLGFVLNSQTGKFDRLPNLTDFAKKYGVTNQTLTNWRKRPDFLNAVNNKMIAKGIDRVPNIMDALYRRCVRHGMAYDIELYLAYFQNWSRTQSVKMTVEKFQQDDLRYLISLLPKQKQSEFYGFVTKLITEAESVIHNAEITEHPLALPGGDTE